MTNSLGYVMYVRPGPGTWSCLACLGLKYPGLNDSLSLSFLIKFSKPSTTATFTLHRVFCCIACTWVVIGCQRDLLLLGRLLI